MLICLVFSLRATEPDAPEMIAGHGYALTVHRRDEEGPFYPHVAEKTGADSYRFFAGRLHGTEASARLPEGHPVRYASAEDWSFRGEEPDGSWIALKFDRARDVLSIAADVFNVQRWFYGEQNGSWYLANSLIFLNRVMKQKPGIEERAIPYMLQWGYLPCHVTPLRNVFELDAGEILTIRAGKGLVTRRRVLPVFRRAVADGQDYPAVIAETMIAGVRDGVRDLKSVTVPLSGGIDSRFLLACALETLEPAQITTMTFGAAGSLDARIGIAVAQYLGVKSIRLEKDSRSIGPIMEQNFGTAEGMYWTWPDFPVMAFHRALPQNSYVLSGYIGDPVFGSKEKGEDYERSAEGSTPKLISTFRDSASACGWESVRPLLEIENADPLGIEARFADLPGLSLQEKFDQWYFGPHTTNRTHYALFAARHKAYYVTPFIQNRVLEMAFALPPAVRRKRTAYFAALGRRFPDVYAFPTTNNFGFPLSIPVGLRINSTRAWRAVWARIDGLLCLHSGRILYHHPRVGHTHPREFMRDIHRADVLEALEELKTLKAFRRTALDRVIAAYRDYRLPSMPLVRGLMTVHQWLRYYGN